MSETDIPAFFLQNGTFASVLEANDMLRPLAHVAIASLLLVAGCTGSILTEDGKCSDCDVSGSGAASGVGPGAGRGGTAGLSNGGEPPGVEGVGWTTRFPRLSHVQWENTVRDLLRLDAAPELAGTFSLDPDDARFDTYAVRFVSSNLWADYQRAADVLAEDVAQDPTKLGRLRAASAPNDAAAFVTELVRRAYRRPPAQSEIDSYVALFNRGPELLGGADAFADGAELVLRAVLQSVHFLYRVESSTVAEDDKVWLSPFEVATRLSYALWNTMPSDELLAAAQNGELLSAESVKGWVQKLVSDPRGARTLVSFHEQLFHIGDYGSIAKNGTLFPTFTPDLAPVLQDEARLFFEEVAVKANGGIDALLTSPVTYVNQQTAPFYGVAGTFGPDLQRVELDPTKRAGILTQLGFLSKYGSQTQSDPILRGVHISLELLCLELAPPPAGVPPLPEIAEGQTNRQRVEQSTSVAPCNGCHEVYINPVGFAFENYDAVGQWRDTDNGQPVDSAATYVLDGASVSYGNAVELSAILAQSPSVHECYSKNWLEYVIGRPPAVEEDGAIQNISAFSGSGASMSDLLAAIGTLDTFRARPRDTVSP